MGAHASPGPVFVPLVIGANEENILNLGRIRKGEAIGASPQ
jgi:hypothetical protein